MPVALAVLLLMFGRHAEAPGHFRRFAAGAVLLGMLSLAQIVFFGTLGIACGVAVLLRSLTHRRMLRTSGELLLLFVALLIAFSLGGFLSFERQLDSAIVWGKRFYDEPVLQSVLHHLTLFGLPLISLFVFPFLLRRRSFDLRVALLAAAVVGFVVPNLASYARSWDIVKFYGVGAFFANLVLAVVFWRSTEEAALP